MKPIYEDTIAAIERLTAQEGHPPSLRELTKELGLASVAPLQYRLDKLAELNLVTWKPGAARTLRVVKSVQL